MRGTLKQKIAINQASMTTEFEVRCDHCDVSFPVGTKRCMYCGGRPGHKPLFARQITVDPLGDIELLNEPFEPLEPGAPVARPIAPIDEPEEEEVEQARGSIFRLFGNLSWVILFALITLYRACTG
jgi:hypothetical protein